MCQLIFLLGNSYLVSSPNVSIRDNKLIFEFQTKEIDTPELNLYDGPY